MTYAGYAYRVLVGTALVAAGALQSGHAKADGQKAAEITMFEQYCQRRYSNAECEGALRHILADKEPDFFMALGYNEDAEAFEESLHSVVRSGRLYRPKADVNCPATDK